MNYIVYGPTTKDLISSIQNGELNVHSYVWTNFAGEVFGSALLLLIGLGVLSSILLRQKEFKTSKVMLFGLTWMGAVFIAVVIAFGIGNSYLREMGHASVQNGKWAGSYFLNPALIIAKIFLAINPKNIQIGNYLPICDGLIFILGEIIGMTIGTLLMYSIYYQMFKNSQNNHDQLGSQLTIKSCFYTFGIKQNNWLSLLGESVAVFTICCFINCISFFLPNNSTLTNFFITFAICAISYGLGGTTGMALNPMRDIVPRTLYMILPVRNLNDKVSVSADWNYAWVPTFGPIVGAIVATIVTPGFLYNLPG